MQASIFRDDLASTLPSGVDSDDSGGPAVEGRRDPGPVSRTESRGRIGRSGRGKKEKTKKKRNRKATALLSDRDIAYEVKKGRISIDGPMEQLRTDGYTVTLSDQFYRADPRGQINPFSDSLERYWGSKVSPEEMSGSRARDIVRDVARDGMRDGTRLAGGDHGLRPETVKTVAPGAGTASSHGLRTGEKFFTLAPGEIALGYSNEQVSSKWWVSSSLHGAYAPAAMGLIVTPVSKPVGEESVWPIHIFNASKSTAILPIGCPIATIQFTYCGPPRYLYKKK